MSEPPGAIEEERIRNALIARRSFDANLRWSFHLTASPGIRDDGAAALEASPDQNATNESNQ
jgi:hypothetical protein